MNDSSFEAMAEEIEGLLGIDPADRPNYAADTVVVHGYRDVDPATGAIGSPIYQSATFAHPALGRSTGYCYSRCGNPTRLELENTVALLEGGVKSFALSSGMTAIATILKLFASGDHIIVCDDLYGGTYRLFSDIYANYGLEFTYLDTSDLDAVKAGFRPNTKAVFTETPTNPTMKVADIAALSALCKEHDALLIVDNTFLTAYYQRPFDFGADIVVYSGTKYLCGHNDVLAGFVVVKERTLIEPIYNAVMSEGGVLAPFDSWLMLRSLKTLGLRLQKQEENAARIAAFLKEHPHVREVLYAGDPESPYYELSCKQADGFGAMISFRVDTPQRVPSVLERVKLILFAESLGGTESLITYPLVQTHGAMPAAMRDALGIDDTLLRLSVGIEDAGDLIADLDQALNG